MGGALGFGGTRCGVGHVPGGRSVRRRRSPLVADPAVRRFIVRQASRVERETAGAAAQPWDWRPAPDAGPAGGAPVARRGRRPVRLTRRGRLVVVAFMLLLCGLVAAVAAAPGRAADPERPRATAVVQPGDTLWDFAARNVPGRDPYAAIEQIRRLNHLEGYVIHPGQRLLLPRRR